MEERYFEKRIEGFFLPVMELTEPFTHGGAGLVEYGVAREEGGSRVYGRILGADAAAAARLFDLWVKTALVGFFLEHASLLPELRADLAALQAHVDDSLRDRASAADFRGSVFADPSASRRKKSVYFAYFP